MKPSADKGPAAYDPTTEVLDTGGRLQRVASIGKVSELAATSGTSKISPEVGSKEFSSASFDEQSMAEKPCANITESSATATADVAKRRRARSLSGLLKWKVKPGKEEA